MARRTGLQYRLTRAYLIQMLLISVATLLGVWATAQVIEQVLVKQALIMEAEHYWQNQAGDDNFPRPNTRHLLGYLSSADGDAIPAPVRALPPGYHRLTLDGEEPIIYVERRGADTLYLIFDEDRVSMLALMFGIVPLSAVLLFIYIASFLTWRRSRKLVSPLVQLAELLRQTPADDPRAALPDLSLVQPEADSEVAVLVVALESYASRLVGFVERERQFTRDASHELRTPLAVIRANMELLAGPTDADAARRRIEDTVGDMEALIETLLLLARSESRALPEEEIVVNDLVCNLAERLQPLAQRKAVRLRVEQSALLSLNAAETVLTMVLTNLMRNAINYTGSGQVTAIVGAGFVIVEDTGPGMDATQLERLMQPFERGVGASEGGHGLGLAIVQRLCERARWKVEVASAPGQGTSVRISFPFWQRQ